VLLTVSRFSYIQDLALTTLKNCEELEGLVPIVSTHYCGKFSEKKKRNKMYYKKIAVNMCA
jgi:hypothetical protein